MSGFAVQMRREAIENQHGQKLIGILHDTASKELVIICHGFRSSKERIPMVNLATSIANNGISSFRFDFAGNGESEGSFQYGNYWSEAEDLRSVVQHFHAKKRSVAALIGHSKGGNVVLLYASKYKDVHAVVNISGRFDLTKGIESRLGKDFLTRIKQNGFIDVKNKEGQYHYRVTEGSLMDRLSTETLAACKLTSPNCRVVTIHGGDDKIVPLREAYEFAKCIANHEVRVVSGADHEFTSHQDELIALVLDFLNDLPQRDRALPHQSSRSRL